MSMNNPKNILWRSQWNSFLQSHPELILPNIYPALPEIPSKKPAELASDEAFWSKVYDCYPKRNQVINLNNGAVSSSPLVVQQAFTTYYTLLNQAPSYYMWKVMDMGKELIRQGIAHLIGADADEVAMLRNTTESLNNIIFGIPLQAGDEVILSKQDYSKAVSSWKQRELREGIKLVWVDLDLPHLSDQEIVDAYVSKISDKTRFVQLTHVINWNGQILPIKETITQIKKHNNIDILLDGAHAFALLDIDVKDLGCDYFVAPLHKWLSGPITSGMLYARKGKIGQLWPLSSSFSPQSEDIRKLEELSLVLSPMFLATGYALDFHLQIGKDNKQQRLRLLRRNWYHQAKNLSKIQWMSPAEDEDRICVILNFNLQGHSPESIEQILLKEHQIHVGLVTWENLKGIRITPNIYTPLHDLQVLVEALNRLSDG